MLFIMGTICDWALRWQVTQLVLLHSIADSIYVWIVMHSEAVVVAPPILTLAEVSQTKQSL